MKRRVQEFRSHQVSIWTLQVAVWSLLDDEHICIAYYHENLFY
jgi:hypothetical protein